MITTQIELLGDPAEIEYESESHLEGYIQNFLVTYHRRFEDKILFSIMKNLSDKYWKLFLEHSPIDFLKYCEEESTNVNNTQYELLFLKAMREEVGWIRS